MELEEIRINGAIGGDQRIRAIGGSEEIGIIGGFPIALMIPIILIIPILSDCSATNAPTQYFAISGHHAMNINPTLSVFDYL